MSATVVVPDGEQRAALAVVRSLGRAGYRVVVASSRRRPLAGASRWAKETVRTPCPLREPSAAAEAWVALCSRVGATMLLPVTDAGVLAGFAAAESAPGLRIPPGSREAFLRASDKAAVAAAGAATGLPVPEQVAVDGPGTRPDIAGLRWPVVVKPSRSVVADAAGGRRKLGVAYARSAAELELRLSELPAGGYPVLLQRRIEGVGEGIFFLPGPAGPPAVFAHRRLRERPPSGGVSTLRESIGAPHALASSARHLLEALGWDGIAMVECKVDREGRAWLMEVNARFWGSLQLAVDAGMDFPLRMAMQLEGKDPGRPPAYRTGVRSRWWWGDVDHLIARFRQPEAEAWLPPGTPGRWHTLADVLRPLAHRRRGEVLRLEDPLPALAETLAWLRREG
ncbi:MAG TPA: ATP-grasp domain-containing protein [Gemmatimonadales bacterium]|nr:ATP-grasp domain-containing protein [Gemmatimonadales bacterium]